MRGWPPRGMEYWERLNDVIQKEPIEPRDIFFHAMLRPLGIQKGTPFKPDTRQTRILTAAVLVGEATAKANSADRHKTADRSSRMDLRKNADGSVDIYCGPKPPAGFEQNWIPTVTGKKWFRFYQPTDAYFDRSWPLPDFEQVSASR